ncbi:uncharacterized protein LOC135130334 isoform X2 [Zophobas morio]|uniref:uncharacterized protein LOC135130334 isoform X2 n=1 Tax=Zophobas morio TaxID=2755281 RepID=UPI00308320B0
MESNTIQCKHCKKKFESISSRNKHLRTIHNDNSQNSSRTSNIICPSCTVKTHFSTFHQYSVHLSNIHDVSIKLENLEFENESSFAEWKEHTEKKLKSFYMLNATCGKSTLGKVYYYECHRSNLDKFESKCKLRTPKLSGSIKINGACPSRIRKQTYIGSSRVSVTFTSTHYGHQLELKCQPLSATEKTTIINQIKSGVSQDHIIEKAREINEEVAEWNSGDRKNVVIYKKPGEKYEGLHDSDFVLAYINKEMEYMLQTYGCNIICMDATHGTNPYNYELTTILILDDENIGYPTVFLISNRKDKIIQEVLLTELKRTTSTISPKYFMSDDTNIYFDAWTKIMGNSPQRLLCTWHIKKNWTIQSKAKISNKEVCNKVQKDLEKLLKEVEEKEFLRLTEELFDYLRQQNEEAFLDYLQKYYFQDRTRIGSWAHCYRLHAGINTNMHLEALHKTLKYNYFCGKTVRRLETCLDMLDKLLKDKSWKRVASIVLPTASHKHLVVNKAHRTAMSMSFESISESDSKTYLVHSQNKIDFYEVKLTNPSCDCQRLRCPFCNVCIHTLTCSCHESIIKNNFCKHMHLVAMYINMTKRNSTQDTTEAETGELAIAEESETNKRLEEELIDTRISEMQQRSDSDATVVLKNQCQEMFNFILNKCNTMAKCQNLLENLTDLSSKLDEENNTPVIPVATRKRKIDKQTFFPRKKR